VFTGTVRQGAVEALGVRWPLGTASVNDGQAVHYGIRPSDLQLADSGIAARVVVIEPTGAETELLVQVGDTQLVVVLHGRTSARPDDIVHLAIDPAKSHVFDGSSGLRLG
jgi:multiple sugar transport system ATP-binding protein